MPTITRTALPIDQNLFGTMNIDGQVFERRSTKLVSWTVPFNTMAIIRRSVCPAVLARTACR